MSSGLGPLYNDPREKDYTWLEIFCTTYTVYNDFVVHTTVMHTNAAWVLEIVETQANTDNHSRFLYNWIIVNMEIYL